MPHADTPPATPTPEGLVAALTLIDRIVILDTVDDGDAIEAAIDVARAAVAYDAAVAAYMNPGGPLCGEALADLHAAVDRAHEAKTAAVARLCALATGAKAGEGAGGS